jgi:type VI secretion system FHA domain protein
LHLGNADPDATMRAIGEVFRAMAEGLREVLMSRAAIKGDMRVERTMIQARNNNALKFSVNVDDAVAGLLQKDRPGYMPALAATKEAFTDIKRHELAVIAGVQTALMSLLQRFDPATLEKRLSAGLLAAVLPAARKARYWDSFREVHGQIAREAEDDFQAVFGKEFAKAYTAQTRKEEAE